MFSAMYNSHGQKNIIFAPASRQGDTWCSSPRPRQRTRPRMNPPRTDLPPTHARATHPLVRRQRPVLLRKPAAETMALKPSVDAERAPKLRRFKLKSPTYLAPMQGTPWNLTFHRQPSRQCPDAIDS